jgi:hypothetical protein
MVIAYIQLDIWFAGSNTAEGYGFLRAVKIRSKTSFQWEVKLSIPCRKSLKHVKIPTGIKRDTS